MTTINPLDLIPLDPATYNLWGPPLKGKINEVISAINSGAAGTTQLLDNGDGTFTISNGATGTGAPIVGVLSINGQTGNVILTAADLGATTGSSTPGTVQATGTTYTLAAGDAGAIIEQNSASDLVVTVPDSSTVPYPVGTSIEFRLYGTGTLTLTGAFGVNLRSPAGLRLTTRYASAAITKRDTDEWIVAGYTVA